MQKVTWETWPLCPFLALLPVLEYKLIWLSDTILLFFSGLLPVLLSGLFGQELKAHVKWCDVRVGASR